MNYYVTAIVGILTFCLAMYLLLKKTAWFHRSEIKKSNQPKEAHSTTTPLSILDYYTKTKAHYEFFYQVDKDRQYEEVIFYPSSNERKVQITALYVERGFLEKQSRRNIAQMFKLLGYTNRLMNPNVLVNMVRSGVAAASYLLRGRLLVMGLIFTALISFSLDESLAFFTEFIGIFVMFGLFFYALYLLKEFIAYFLQNIYSLKLSKSFGVTTNEYKSVFIYLWTSFILFFSTQFLKWLLIATLMFVIIMLYN
ncbi:hypothetical protein ACFO4L_11390 [Bacillus daqingensis]|uniref:DUF2812 domain-containing protein n=1 Tax=Bacillus daqingensis TaxID=872396 RepID=A0ABV9NV50_9BACI